MPRVTFLDKKKKLNYLSGLLRMYKDAAGLTSAQIANEIGYQPDSVRRKFNGPVEGWRVVDLIRVCDLLGVPVEEAIEATKRSM